MTFMKSCGHSLPTITVLFVFVSRLSYPHPYMSINKRAIFSGALGATASFIAKLALAPDSPVTSAVHNICTTKVHVVVEKIIKNDIPPWFCPTVSLASRGICLLFMIGMNAFMISTFLDGMDESGSVVGTALSTAANFCCSAMYGIIFFGEVVPPTWCLGATLIAIGMWLLSAVRVIDSNASSSSKKRQ